MHTTILARVVDLLTQLVEGPGDSLWMPRRTLMLADAGEMGFDANDLVSARRPTVRNCCGGTSLIANLTR
jgi:hypothetical protein